MSKLLKNLIPKSKSSLYFLLSITCVFSFLFLLPAHAEDMSKVGDTFSFPQVTPSNTTGAATINIPIKVTPGRKNIAPNLLLNYNSSGSNGWIGVGWSMDMGAIQRATKRGVDYTANDYIVSVNGATSELVPRNDWGLNYYYGAKIEGAFSKHFYNTATGGWEVTTKDGTKYYCEKQGSGLHP